MSRLPTVALAVVALGACHDANVAGPTPPAGTSLLARNLPAPGARGITVMTRNIYLGANLDPVLTAAPQDIPIAVAQAFAQIQATNFAARAQKLADEIAATNPHLVGLQEVSLYRRQSPGDAVVGGTLPATTVAIDFQQLLLQALAARGLSYAPVATHTGLDVEVPMFTGIGPSGPTFDDIRFTDHDVILARSDVPTSHPQAAHYGVSLPVSVGGTTILIFRGWAAVDVSVAGVDFRFVNTHFETQVAPPVQEAQAAELIGILGAETRPVMLVGDFNSAANVFQTRSYGMLTGAGFIDTWAQRHPRDVGLTCCHADDLLNAAPTFDQRLDIVFWRDAFSARTGRVVGGVHVDIVGEEQSDRTPSGLWPSDHAGVVATLNVPQEVARR